MNDTKKTLPAIDALESTRKSIVEARRAEEDAIIEKFVNGPLAELIEDQNEHFAGGTLAILPRGISYQRFCEFMKDRCYIVKSAGTNYGQQLVDITW